jgi:hypothetical protein
MVGSWDYPQTLDLAGLEKLAMDKHHSLLRKSVNYSREKFYNTPPFPP